MKPALVSTVSQQSPVQISIPDSDSEPKAQQQIVLLCLWLSLTVNLPFNWSCCIFHVVCGALWDREKVQFYFPSILRKASNCLSDGTCTKRNNNRLTTKDRLFHPFSIEQIIKTPGGSCCGASGQQISPADRDLTMCIHIFQPAGRGRHRRVHRLVLCNWCLPKVSVRELWTCSTRKCPAHRQPSDRVQATGGFPEIKLN